MPGAGSAAPIAWAEEESYLGGTGQDPTYREPGSNIQTDTAELSRNMLEILAPDEPETQAFLAQNLEGQFGLSWILANDEYHRFTFIDGNTGFTSGQYPSVEWYLGVNYLDGTTERQIKGWAPATCSIAYNGSTEAVRVTVSGPYGDEENNTEVTPGSVERTLGQGDEVPGFGTTLSIDGTNVGDMLQTATISFEQISRLITGNSQKPIDVVAGNVQQSVDMASVYDGPDRYEQILGSSGATEVEETVEELPGAVTFEADGNEIASYDFDGVKPNTYNWTDLANNDANLNEEVTYLARGVTGSDPA